jgi:hypothetical protein
MQLGLYAIWEVLYVVRCNTTIEEYSQPKLPATLQSGRASCVLNNRGCVRHGKLGMLLLVLTGKGSLVMKGLYKVMTCHDFHGLACLVVSTSCSMPSSQETRTFKRVACRGRQIRD